MKKKMVLLFVVMAMVLSVVGCQSTTVDEKENNKPSVTKKEEDTQTEPGLYKPDGTFVSWEELTSEEYCTLEYTRHVPWEEAPDAGIEDLVGIHTVAVTETRPILIVKDGVLDATPQQSGFVSYNDEEWDYLEGKLVVDASVKSLGVDAFINREKLTEVVLPEGITEIPDGAFSYCWNLEKIEIPESVVSYGETAFMGCAFAEFTIPNSVTFIGEECFSQCKNLTSIIIPGSVRNLGSSVFYNCIHLKKIYISSKVQTVGELLMLNERQITIYTDADTRPKGWSPTFAEYIGYFDDPGHQVIWNATLEDFNK